MVPMLIAGLGMVVGGIVGANAARPRRYRTASPCARLLLVFLFGNHATTALLTFIIGFAQFLNSSPQQLLMVQGEGGGELIAGAAVQIAFNLGNPIGSIVGGAALTTATAMKHHFTGIAGAPHKPARRHPADCTRRYEARA